MQKQKHFLIYKITNLINNKIYIGQHVTTNIDDDYMGSGDHIKNAIKKYGIENFHIELIEETDSPNEREIYWIKEKNSYSNGYNKLKHMKRTL